MSKNLDDSKNQPPENGDDAEQGTHQKQDNSENQLPDDLENMLKIVISRYRVVDFDNCVETTVDKPDETGKPNPSQVDFINNLSPIPSLEELKRAMETDIADLLHHQQGPEVVTRVERAFYILVGTGIGDFLWTGDIKLLLTMLVFFLVLLFKLLTGHSNS